MYRSSKVGRFSAPRGVPRWTDLVCIQELSAGEREMGNAAGRAGCLNLEPLLKTLEIVPYSLPTTQDDGHDRNVHVVDEVRCEEFANGCWPSANSYIQAAGRFQGRFKGLGGARVDEVERGSTLHLNGRPEMMGEDEHRSVERRIGPPPPFPVLVSPGATLGAELVPPHNLGADAGAPVAGESIVDSGAPCLALHPLEAAGWEEPLVEPVAGMPEGRFEALTLARTESVERNRQVVDP